MAQTGTIGIVGGGQLGRMLTEAALPLGFKVIVLDPGENCPAAQAGAEQIVGGLYDHEALKELAARADFITVEIEHLDAGLLQELVDNGKPVDPAPKTVRLIQDKYEQKKFLRKNAVPIADFVEITDTASARKALDKFNGKMLLKSRMGAYDGRGNAVVARAEDIGPAMETLGDNLYAEKFVPFKKELAVMVARDQGGNVACYPITETVHERNICVETFTPADVGGAAVKRTEEVALSVAQHLEGAGVFGIEMFLTADDNILVNEIAPRVHNSGHYTMEACETSQFEQHVRAITGMELGSTDLKVPAAAMINILGERDGPTEVKGLDEAQAIQGVSVHMYGKSPTKIDRKMGHITAVADTLEEARENAEQARRLIDV
ncbi:MAG TPA: 5-(carboxyamino)imidazole ribonucleotide synthase [Candidatus Saccharimonadales bacterium]|nr:5-(carboxyamino)imidazole ribonucleotide synthase [Candidatus Saccharimonadales bacterium]